MRASCHAGDVVSVADIDQLELIHAQLPLVRPFATRYGVRTAKDVLLVRVRTRDGAVGWGECAAELTPTYAPEHIDGAWIVLRDHLAPRELAGRSPDEIAGNHMAKAALEMAVLDARLQTDGRSLASWLGGTRDRVEVGVVVERYDERSQAAAVAAAHVAEGYRRIKLKIAPGCDVPFVSAVRAAIGDAVRLWVDANGAYSLDDTNTLAALDVELLEQPLRAGDLLDHAALRDKVRTIVCLDESIASLDDARLALHLRAADALALKPGRLGGLSVAVAVHDLCRDAGVPVWCGGMLETGIGRAANLALASLPGFTMPGDISASRRYFACDLTEPFELDNDGCIAVPQRPGLGVEVDERELGARTLRREPVSLG
jgi:O-succinylbenzoate synthase